ncbi:MAG: DUF2878 domain-containing protein [Planctomycetota bacterium]
MNAAKGLNFLMYQVGWLACVIGASMGAGGPAAAFAGLLVVAHICLAAEAFVELQLTLTAMLAGCVVDGVCIWAGILRFSDHGILPGLPPFWMTVLWMQFATTLRYSLSWLQGHLLLAGISGLIGAPAAFLGGARLGAVELSSPAFPGLLILGILWSMAMPLLVWCSVGLGKSRQSAGYRLFRRTG